MRGRRVVADGEPTGVDVKALRALLTAAQPDYRDPRDTDPSADAMTAASEVEYRAAMGLDTANQQAPTPPKLGAYPEGRVLYDATIP